MGEALKNRATGLINALLDPVATIEGYVNLLRAIPQLPELIDQYVAEFLYDLDDEERAEQLGKLLTQAVLSVVPRPNIPNLSGITKKLGKAGEKVKRGARLARWSSPVVEKAAKKLLDGAREVTVKTKAQAEELFLRLYQGSGYQNTTGVTGRQVRNMYPKGKRGTYHWDLHDTLHGGRKHVQIHPHEGRPIIRIFFEE